LAFFEVGVCAEEFEMGAVVFEAAAVFDDFFEGDTGPAGGTNGAFTPGCVNELVAVTGVLVDLLDTSGSGALQTDDCRLAGKFGFILELGEGDLLGIVDQAFDFEEVFAGVDFRDAAVVTDKEVRILGDLRLQRLARLSEDRGETCLNQSFLWIR
jgi:hypothetical protein